MTHVDFTKQPPVILSLCPGMRGLERGFDRACEQLGWKPHRTAAYVEIEAFIIFNLVKQMEQGVLEPAPIHSNIKTFDGKPFRGKIHGIFGGYPCQPFSLAGERKGTEDPRHLWPYISGIIAAARPVFCFFENVAGHLTMGYPEVYRGLRDLGYTVEAGIFTAEEVGAPHQRERVFILAILADTRLQRSTRTGEQTAGTEQPGEMVDTKGIREVSGMSGDIPEANGGPYGELSRFAEQSSELANSEMSECTSRIGTRSGGNGPSNFSTKGVDMADTDGAGRGQSQRSITDEPEQFTTECNCTGDRWPAGPGQSQHEWEAPRVESRLGFTVNGYNFREDLLRMAGNGVVEQTAELAFLTLLEKFR